MAKFSLSPPWIIFYGEIEAFFKEDQEVTVTYNDKGFKDFEVKLYVNNREKADALYKLLPKEKKFGDVTMKIIVVPVIKSVESKIELFRKAFNGNNAVSCIESGSDVITSCFNYILFTNEVVQYFTDDIGDPHGITSTLYQDIAKDIFDEHEGIFFCTDTK